MKSFTPEDILLYLYKETSPEHTAAIEKALSEDWSLQETLRTLQESMEGIVVDTVSPRQEAVENVLLYAKEVMAETA
ncbi:hypothetical protein QEG73_24300 [Chitinophagaceae bacterium 26-R-25]|nr:hypothetical protein [Chitinophagaceae bacterium 26-R-25]